MAVNVDDGTLPVDNSLSSPAFEGAGEFRALKTKLNKLFLNSGVGATYGGLIDSNNMGLNVAISDASNSVLQSSRFKVTRTASQPKDTLGMYSESVLANNVTCPANILSAFYAITTANPGATFLGMYSLNSQVVQQNHNCVGTIVGLYVFFADRTSSGIAAPGGIGSNRYNIGAVGLMFDSYARSSSGEYCGWKTGIKFQPTSMDRDLGGPGYCIDISGLNRALTNDPRTSYNCKGAIRLADRLAVMWDDAEDVMTYFDSNTGRWTVRYQNNLIFEIAVATGNVYKNGVQVL